MLMSSSASPASDIWALGCLLYFLCCGAGPFYGNTSYLLFENIRTAQYSFNSHPRGSSSRVGGQGGQGEELTYSSCPFNKLFPKDIQV
jgi:serine/threonine protein kinase